MSTILKALRRLEEEQSGKSSTNATELDRQILAETASKGERPRRRTAMLVVSVLLSGAFGMWGTFAAFSYFRTDPTDSQLDAAVVETAAIDLAEASTASAEATAAEVSEPAEESDEPVVIVVADVLKRRAANAANAAETSSETIVRRKRPPPTAGPDAAAKTKVPATNRSKAAPGARFARRQDSIARALAAREPVAARAKPVSRTSPGKRDDSSQRAVAVPATTLRQRKPAAPMPVKAVRETSTSANAVHAEAAKSNHSAPPVSARKAMPSVAVTSTVWHPRPERRIAVFSVEEDGGTRTVELREGQRLGPLQLSEIGLMGVTFEHEGVKTEYRIGGDPNP
jgi:hypothetical protein